MVILNDEPERRSFNEAIEKAESYLMSAASFVEASIMLEACKGYGGVRDFDLFVARAGIKLADADEQTGWYVEPSIRLKIGAHDWGFYTRYEDLEGARAQDRFDQWELGVNYWPTENVVFKVDYRDRTHDLDSESGRDFNAFDLGVGYQF